MEEEREKKKHEVKIQKFEDDYRNCYEKER
jgi:hypothetical protein